MIKVSIIVPIYNVEKYLRKCLESLVNQTLNEIEILCVNDGSTDHSESIIDEYVKNYPLKVKKLNKINGGLSDARNFAIPYCVGECIAFVDSDDWVEDNMFEKMYQIYKKQNCDLVVCGIREVNERGKTLALSSLFEDKVIDTETLILNTNAAWNKLYDKKLFDNIRFPVGLWYEDLATIPLLAIKCDKIGTINECFYNYLYRSTSISKTYSTKISDIILVFNILIESNCFSNDFLCQLFSNHLYFTLLRCGLISLKSERIKVLEQLHMFIENNNFSDNISKHGSLNQRMLLTLFQLKWYSSLMNIIRLQWQVKNILIK